MGSSVHPSLKSVFIGEESLLIQCAEIAQRSNIDIIAIVSSSPLIRKWSATQNIDRLELNQALAENLRAYQFDYLFSVANLKRLSPDILQQARLGAINFHDGPLPDYAGLYTTSWALIAQENHHAVTWHLMADEIDSGPILYHHPIKIESDETAFSLNVKCYEAGITSFDSLVTQIVQGNLSPQVQDLSSQALSSQTQFAKNKRPTAGATIHWDEPAEAIHALVRGLTFNEYPNPLSYPKILLPHTLLLAPHLFVTDSSSQAPPGTIVGINEHGLTITTQTKNVVVPTFIDLADEHLNGHTASERYDLALGVQLPILADTERLELTRLHERAARYEGRWHRELQKLTDLEIPYDQLTSRKVTSKQSALVSPIGEEVTGPPLPRLGDESPHNQDNAGILQEEAGGLLSLHQKIAIDWRHFEAGPQEELVAALLMTYFGLLADHTAGHIFYQPPQANPLRNGLHIPYFAQQIPVYFEPHDTLVATLQNVLRQVRSGRTKGGFANDLLWRMPDLAHLRQNGVQLSLSIAIEQPSVDSPPFGPNHNGVAPQQSGLIRYETVSQHQSVAQIDEASLVAPLAATGDAGCATSNARGPVLRIRIAQGGEDLKWLVDPTLYSKETLLAMQGQFSAFLKATLNATASAQPETPLQAISIVNDEERLQLESWNCTNVEYDSSQSIATLFTMQVLKTPNLTALIVDGIALSYQQLNERSNQLARHLQALDIGPDVAVGVFLHRTHDLLITLLGILKAGGAYLPLDPAFPPERLAFMVEDTQTPLLITQRSLLEQLPAQDAQTILIDEQWPTISKLATDDLPRKPRPDALAYIIYTSGSTGRPKGVMVEQRNVVNFFVGMDEQVPHQSGDIWLAVTSLSFDISVLELLWTLCRGLTIVLYDGRPREDVGQSTPVSSSAVQDATDKPIDFSLFYFASDESTQGQTDKYELLLEGAKFADAHGFAAVWTPERHFDAFGGLYPNPAITGAALATLTKNVQIRAGSCVLPLHNPIRVAEDWAVIDNLSNGRVGISFAAGWQPNDFVLQPQHFAERKELMLQQIETVRKLWQGGSVTLEGGNGPATVKILPRPIQPDLPIWLTAAGNPETYRQAGQLGYNILTHLLGQSVAELADKINLYRQAWSEAGHPGRGHVTVMLHTFIHEEMDVARSLVREPLTDYLRSSLFLIQKAAWSFPTFQQRASETGKTALALLEEEDLSQEEMDALLAYAFERYFEESGLLGTPDKALHMVTNLMAHGVDEIACQIDFGLPTETALASLPLLKGVQDKAREFTRELARQQQATQQVNGYPTGYPTAYSTESGSQSNEQIAKPTCSTQPTMRSIPELIHDHQVTHFQCTPSMMRMLLVDPAMSQALGQLKACLVGGEALPQALVSDLLPNLNGQLLNMYGPTETTIWSSTYTVNSGEQPILIGKPIANTQLYVVDKSLKPRPIGLPGELLIGGDGVVRGYMNRPELTAERFIADPFGKDALRDSAQQPRLYRTGDLACFRSDGNIEFLGRMDFQVKLRGYRIELGEIEAQLARHKAIQEAVVTIREDVPNDRRLVAYLLNPTAIDAPISEPALRGYLKEFLPDYMIPAHFVWLTEFPLTPNQKTDRKALPAPMPMLDGQKSDGKEPQAIPPSQAGQQTASTLSIEQLVSDDHVPTRFQYRSGPKNNGDPSALALRIIDIWQQYLNRPQIGLDESFFDLGGHSLLAVQIHRQLCQELQLQFTIADMFRYTTVRSLCEFLQDKESNITEVQQQAMDRATIRKRALGNRIIGRRRR